MRSIFDYPIPGQNIDDINYESFLVIPDDIHDIGVRSAIFDYSIQIKICGHPMLKHDTTINKHRVFYPQAHKDIQFK